MDQKTYNGWTNYATWNVALWMGNDAGSAGYWDDAARNAVQDAIDGHGNPYADSVRQAAKRILADRMKDGHEEQMRDLLGAALGDVEWNEIAEHYVSEIEIYHAGWNMPGYMPESEPATFTDLDEAKGYIAEEIRNMSDQIEDNDEAYRIGQIADAVEKEKGGFSVMVSSDKYQTFVYWVTKE